MTPIRTLRPLAKVVLSTQSDERLVALARQGSEDAFAEIVRRYRPGLVRLARSLGTGDRADDVVQDGLVRAWRALQRSDSEIDLRPWLTTIVRNRAFTAHSTNRPTEELDETIDGVSQPGDIVIMREELRSAVSAVNALPESQREALVRSALAGESHDQIALALATTPGAVRQLIFRARTGLREAVGAVVPFPLVRALADIGTGGAAAGGTAAGGAVAAMSGAGGASVGLKALAVVVVGATVAGSGIAIERHTSGAEAKETSTHGATTTAPQNADAATGQAATTTSPGAEAPHDQAEAPDSTVTTAETKSSTATRSSDLVDQRATSSGTLRVPDGSDQSNETTTTEASSPQGSDPESGDAPQQQPHQGQQPVGGQTGGGQTGQPPAQAPPPHQGDGTHQQPQAPPPPPPPTGDTAGTGDGDGHHPTGGGQQPQPTDTHDGDRSNTGGLVDLTLGN